MTLDKKRIFIKYNFLCFTLTKIAYKITYRKKVQMITDNKDLFVCNKST